jgi:hypothetical protein
MTTGRMLDRICRGVVPASSDIAFYWGVFESVVEPAPKQTIGAIVVLSPVTPFTLPESVEGLATVKALLRNHSKLGAQPYR